MVVFSVGVNSTSLGEHSVCSAATSAWIRGCRRCRRLLEEVPNPNDPGETGRGHGRLRVYFHHRTPESIYSYLLATADPARSRRWLFSRMRSPPAARETGPFRHRHIGFRNSVGLTVFVQPVSEYFGADSVRASNDLDGLSNVGDLTAQLRRETPKCPDHVVPGLRTRSF